MKDVSCNNFVEKLSHVSITRSGGVTSGCSVLAIGTKSLDLLAQIQRKKKLDAKILNLHSDNKTNKGNKSALIGLKKKIGL